MSTGKNNSTVLTTTRQGGLDQFPPEFLASTTITTRVRDGVNLDVALTGLTSTIVGAKLEHERTNERKETVDEANFSGITIRDVVTDPETGVAVEVLKSIVTAAAAASLGGIDGDGYYVDVKALSDDWAIVIKSRVIAASLAGAAYVYGTTLDWDLPDVLIAIDNFNDNSNTDTTATGTFTQLTWRTAASWGYEAAVRIKHFGKKCSASVVVVYGDISLTPDTVQKFILSSGTIVSSEGAYDKTESAEADPGGLSDTVSVSTKHNAITIPPVITNGITTVQLVAPAFDAGPPVVAHAGADLKLSASTPTTLNSGATFVGDSILTVGRLGLVERKTITITVP